ncbi:recombinase family protein [Desulfotignum phosphitoxidans]|uniref:Putative resolvase n=1 Tax=Desulfotignum phosphitoxidans DSM 13687 TaxID=1286635 RepID=S0FYX1_9BACT|nr:recombinase family protein [Desulfotignum phosphitoxidans]EMS78404.1 putative resolvase [Desulfotignum phosphitoxidans DSM 13687]
MKNPNKTAGIYIRVSTMNQVDRDSLTTQQERLISYCKAQGYSNYKIFKDAGCSAKNTDRPSLGQLMDAIKADKINYVIVTKLDRITRSIKDLINLVDFFEKFDVKFISVSESIDTSSAMGRFMQHLLGILAQLEREMTAERVSTDMHHRATKGKWNGGIIPYGYTTQAFLFKRLKSNNVAENLAFSKASELCPEPNKLYPYPEETEIIKWMFNNFLEKNSVRETAISLNNRGIKTRNNCLWAQSTVHRILRSPIYVGKISYGKRKTSVNGKLIPQEKDSWTIVDGEHEAIISDEIFDKVQGQLSQISRKPVKKGRIYLLSGLLNCGKCNGRMSGHTFKKKENKKSYSYYKCTNRLQKGKTACEGLSLPANELEDFIVQTLMDLSQNQTFLSDKEKMIEMIKSNAKESKNNTDEINDINSNINKHQEKLNTLLIKLEDGVIDDEDFLTRHRIIKKELNKLKDAKYKLQNSIKSKESAITNLEISFDEICSFGYKWENLTEQGKVMRLRSIIKEITATKEEITMDTYIDVANLTLMDRDSWRPPA